MGLIFSSCATASDNHSNIFRYDDEVCFDGTTAGSGSLTKTKHSLQYLSPGLMMLPHALHLRIVDDWMGGGEEFSFFIIGVGFEICADDCFAPQLRQNLSDGSIKFPHFVHNGIIVTYFLL
jgi:hypothetical protein